MHRRTLPERVLLGASAMATLLPLTLLAYLLIDVCLTGWPRLSLNFLTSGPSRHALQAGVLPAIIGSFYVLGLTALMVLPIGIGTAIYLEEFARPTRWRRLFELNLDNLAGVPSVIYGVLGLGVFVRTLALGRSLLAGAATLALLVLPIVVVSAREGLRAVPKELREAAMGLGSTPWQAVQRVVLPLALPHIITGTVLALARAVGETAPLIVVGALSYVSFVPNHILSPFTALPIQIYAWINRPQTAFAHNAAAGIMVLLFVLMTFNLGASWWRARQHRRGI